jgi:uncharacterized iron-regulated membrane protein
MNVRMQGNHPGQSRRGVVASDLGKQNPTVWRRWLERPEQLWIRRAIFQVHFGIGAIAGAYLFLISLSGSAIVYRNDFVGNAVMAWLVDFHENLLGGSAGRLVNGIGALGLVLLSITGAIIWWPGIKHWRRSLIVDWRAHFPRVNWDLHSALGFWSFPFVLVWGVSAVYFVFPRAFNVLFRIDPRDRFTDEGLFWLTQLHFGRFGRLAEAAWAILGLVPAILAFTGVFICCRRVIWGRPSNPKS